LVDDRSAVHGSNSKDEVNPPTSAGSDACTHLYDVPGVYTVTVTASDPSGNATAIPFQYVVAYDLTFWR
jgi:PKD repeat protein